MSGFGARIAHRRHQLGMTLRDVEAITAGAMSNAYLSQLENGKINHPSAAKILALAAAYHVEPATILEWLGEKSEIKPPPLCPTCGRARIGQSWMQKLGVVIDGADASAGEADQTDWRLPYRSMDAAGSPETAGALAWEWIEELAEEARQKFSYRAPAALHIDTPGLRSERSDNNVIALYDGTRLLAVATVFRDQMNFAVLVRWRGDW